MSLVSTNKYKISNAFFAKPCFPNWCPLYLKYLWTDLDETKGNRLRIDGAIVRRGEIILKFFLLFFFYTGLQKKGVKNTFFFQMPAISTKKILKKFRPVGR